MELIKQEVSLERWTEIPQDIRDVLSIWRPTPLVRAKNLEKALKTPARIYFKDESQSPPGSHKPNTAVAQAYYNKQEGISRLTTETGAGQWGTALSFACKMFDLECRVFMVKVSYQQKPYRRSMMHLWGGNVTPSPAEETEAGKKMLAADPDTPGSLGMAISEAVEAAVVRYPNADTITWLQEEPENMGAWNFVKGHLYGAYLDSHSVRRVSRRESGSPATGSAAVHAVEQADILDRALG